MRTYIIRRLLLVIPTALIVSVAIFILIRFIPGDIVDVRVGQLVQTGASIEDVEAYRIAMEKELGIDVPILTQYGRWLGGIITRGDFGTSFSRGTPVLRDIATRWPVTLELGLLGLIIAQLIALPVGIYSALRQDTWGDYIARSFAIMCIAVPGFWVATMVIVFPSIWWGYMPPIRLVSFAENPIGNLEMFILPAIVLGMAMSGMTMRVTRTMMLEVLRQDYIRTAWGKGLRERVVILRHAWRNALIPVITLIGFQVPVMIGGAVIIEQIFCLPGVGRLLIDATLNRDYTVVSGIMLILGLGVMLINLMVDLTYGCLDPRVRYK